MAFQLKQLVPCLCSIHLLLSIMFFFHANAKPRTCHDSVQDQRSNHTMEDAGLAFHVIDKYSGDLYPTFNLSFHNDSENTVVLSTIDRPIQLWQNRSDEPGVDEASFSVAIVYQPLRTPTIHSGIAFLILPVEALLYRRVQNSSTPNFYNSSTLSFYNNSTLNLYNPTHRSASFPGYSVSVKIGLMLASPTGYNGRIMGVDITIDPNAAAASKYCVWIDYDHVGHSLSVYVDVEGKPKPDNNIAAVQLRISSVTFTPVFFGLLSMGAQLTRTAGFNFSATVDDLPYYPQKGGGSLARKVTLLSSILGSLVVATVVATAVTCYFNSRYRRWHKDLDQLAKSMEQLPGMPTKVDFADIKKATGNFHESMKLGGGAFGTVYRCTLPAAISKTEQPLDVAIKRFTRDVQNRRYDDFLAEVSIINRLRHKNIVPLVGWSYNKGEPLLVFEFMTNGSLDQHLFPKGGSGTRQRRTGAAIRRWATRYEIVRDIATGLHYVHHEYEPMVLHCDIKASNVMLDMSFRARLGDFGLACTVAIDRNSATGIGGTWGYIAPEYALCGKATRQTDIYALGVLILEVVTGKRALVDDEAVGSGDIHVTDWVWRLHREGRLPACVDAACTASSEDEEQMDTSHDADEERLLLLGLACTNPNPSDRPTMPDVVQVIAKSAPPPMVPPQKPRFVWPPPEEYIDDSAGTSMMTSNLDKSIPVKMRSRLSLGQPATQVRAAFQVRQEYSV